MPITRVEKYKEYRKSLIIESAPILETSLKPESKSNSTKKLNTLTSTLPLNEVMNAVSIDKEENRLIKKRKLITILKISTISLIIILLVVIIILIGIYLF